MRARGVVAAFLAVGALLVLAGSAAPASGPLGFVGDRAARIGYDVWLAPNGRDLFFKPERVGNMVANGFGRAQGCLWQSTRLRFRARAPRDAPVVGLGTGVIWGQVYDALQNGRPAAHPRWARTGLQHC